MSWFRKGKKISREQIDAAKKDVINQLYGRLSFGENVISEGTEMKFVCIQQDIAVLYNPTKDMVEYSSIVEDRLIELLKPQK